MIGREQETAARARRMLQTAARRLDRATTRLSREQSLDDLTDAYRLTTDAATIIRHLTGKD